MVVFDWIVTSFNLVEGWRRGLDSEMKERRWVREKKRWR
jgi:hypothetical protein